MIDVRRLRSLRALADHGTIAAAADALHLTASAVSQQLQALEAEVGQRLMEPHGRSVRLTPAAEVVLRHADAMLVEVERLEASLSQLGAGAGATVRIGGFSTSIQGLIIPALREPALAALEVRIEDVEAPDCFRMLARHELDVVISMEADHAPAKDDARIARHELTADVLDAALPAAHPLATRRDLVLADLSAEPWIAPPLGWSCEHVINAACTNAGFRPDVRHRSHDWSTILALVGEGFGVATVPRLAQFDPPPGVVVRSLGPEAPARHLFAACRRGAEAHPAVAVVIDALRAVAAGRPAVAAA
ncbi:MAG TPA: LysR family transcriptional regulator [Solirubrobacteraceae bacterium]